VVGETEVIRDPDTGEVLDESVNEIARLRAVTVKEKLTICEVVSGNAGAIKKGQGAETLGCASGTRPCTRGGRPACC
jgi:hypothetical protein